MNNRKAMLIYLPLDTDIISITAARQIPCETPDGLLYQNGFIAACANGYVDAFDVETGNSFIYDQNNKEWVVLDGEDFPKNKPFAFDLNNLSFDDDFIEEYLDQYNNQEEEKTILTPEDLAQLNNLTQEELESLKELDVITEDN